jgi:hypothetical protein
MNDLKDPLTYNAYFEEIKMPMPIFVGETDMASGEKEPLDGDWKNRFDGALPDKFPDYIVWGAYSSNFYIELGSDRKSWITGKLIVMYINAPISLKGLSGINDSIKSMNPVISMINSNPVTLSKILENDGLYAYYANFKYLNKNFLIMGANGLTEQEFVDYIRSIIR